CPASRVARCLTAREPPGSVPASPGGPRMGRWFVRAGLACVVAAGAGRVLAGDGFLAETGFDLALSDDAARATASVRWYPNVGHDWLVPFGGRPPRGQLGFPG